MLDPRLPFPDSVGGIFPGPATTQKVYQAVAPERSAETKVGGGGGQVLFVINGLPHQSFVYLECSRRHCYQGIEWFSQLAGL